MKALNLAVTGATHILCETLLEILHERKFPLTKIEVYDKDEYEGDPVTFAKKSLSIKPQSVFKPDAFDLVFNFNPGFVQHYRQQIRATRYVIDLSQQDTLAACQYIVPEVNPQGLDEGNIFTSPDSAAIAVSLILHRLQLDLSQVHVHVMQPVSTFGRAGVDETAKQTASLLNARPVEKQVFDQQIAFNVLPTAAHEGEPSDAEKNIALAVKQLYPGDYHLNVNVVTVPVFFGTSINITLQSYDATGLHYVYDALADTDLFEIIECNQEQALPSVVGDANGTDKIYISRMRVSGVEQNMINMWCVLDNGRKGSTLNGVQMAEILVKSYL